MNRVFHPDLKYVGYSIHDFLDIRDAKTFSDLSKVALRILPRLEQPLGIVSGPISTGGLWGNKTANLIVFQAINKALESMGISIFDQMPFEHDIGRIINSPYFINEEQLLEEFYGPIFRSGYIKKIYFTPKFSSSFGSRWKHNFGRHLQILSIYL